MRKHHLKAGLLLAAGAAGGVWIGRGVAEPSAAGEIKRTILQRIEVPGSAYEVVVGTAEIAAGVASIGRHVHAGVETGMMIEGEVTMSVEGQADALLKAGDSYRIEAGVPHDVRTGATTAKVVAVYVVEKGKPLAIPAP